MHTILVLTAGFVLLALCLVAGRFAGQPPRRALTVFAVLWLIATAINMWIGVTRAGYSVAEELPIFLGLFAVPVVVGVVIARKLAGDA